MLAFMLPVLAGLVPMAPGASAKAALIRDLASNICSPAGDKGRRPVPVRQEHCCILCVTGAAPVDGARLAGGIEAPRLRECGRPAFAPAEAQALPRHLFAGAISLRGPPVA